MRMACQQNPLVSPTGHRSVLERLSNGNKFWQKLRLDQAIASLEDKTLPLPSVEDLSFILQNCRKERNPTFVLRLHAYLHANGLETHASLGNRLVSLLVEVGSVCHAQQVFDSLDHKDERSWNILITGYVKHGQSQVALSLYQKVENDSSLHLSGYSFAALVKACTTLKDVERGCVIHAEIARKSLLDRDVFIGSTLVDMYAKCGSLRKAQEVFDTMPVHNVVAWTALITGYVEHGNGEEALNHLEQMQSEGILLDAVTYICSLKACGLLGAVCKVQMLHAEISKQGLEADLVLASTLVDTYAKCGLLKEAQGVFNKLTITDMVSWTALLSGYVDSGYGEEALCCLERMQGQGISPGPVTLFSGLKACIIVGSTLKGHEIHADLIKKGMERDLFVGSTLVDMYAKGFSLAEAQAVFDKLPDQNFVSWTALISGYAEHGYGEQALDCFGKMEHDGIAPCLVTLVCVLKACGSIGAIYRGQEIHAEIARKGLLEKDVSVGSILVDMYAKCGLLTKAEEVFDDLPVKNVVSWTALVGGYVEHGGDEEALAYFEKMKKEGIAPAPATYVCILKSCTSEGFTATGQGIHTEITRKGLESELLVGNSLVDMYVKYGLLGEAQEVFDKLPVRDVISWTSLITGYAQQGKSEAAFHILNKMIAEGIMPNLVTFGSVLNACSHTGLMDRGQMYLEALSNGYGFSPTLEHYSCMVDLLSRAGHIDKAAALITKMPFCPGSVAWHILVGACQKSGNVQLGRHALEKATRLDDNDHAAYLCMSNIYADAALQEDSKLVETI